MDLQIAKRVQTEIKRLSLEAHLTPHILNELVINEQVNDFATQLAVRVVMTFIGRNVVSNEETSPDKSESTKVGSVFVPTTWWESLKLSVLNWFDATPETISKKVKFTEIDRIWTTTQVTHKTINHYHICPVTEPEANLLAAYGSFLMWGKYFTGSQREYILLKTIAREAILHSTEIHEPNLMKALYEYVQESDFLSEENR